MNHQAIFNTHPNVVQIVGDTAYESVDGELVQVALDVDAVAAEEAKLQAEYVATHTNAIANRNTLHLQSLQMLITGHKKVTIQR